MALRIAIAAAIVVIGAAIAWYVERRRRTDAPTQATTQPPEQLDRADFAESAKPWLVVLFTSKTCASCEGLYDKAAPLESDAVAVVEVEFGAHRELHDRYHVQAAPMTLVADHDGVVRASFLGAFSTGDLWNAVAELRAAG